MVRLWIVVMLPMILCGSAWAQIPTKGNVSFGYSFDRTQVVRNDTINTNGWDASLEKKLFPFVGLVMDIDGHYGNGTFGGFGADVAEHNFIFGPRVSAQVGPVRPFAEVPVGGAHISRSNGISDSDTSFANAAGGGLDYRIVGPLSVRGQLDWIETRFYSQTQNGVRFSTGIAFHF